MLNRYLQMKNAEHNPTQILKRPPHTAMENNLGRAEKWRGEIVREVTQKITEIQNEALGEARIRALNDEINDMMRMKHHWEKRIRELGGANYVAQSNRLARDEGVEVAGGAYRYYGAARKLKGVEDLLKPRQVTDTSKTRSELSKLVNADYFGLRDEEDGILEEQEAKVEKRLRETAEAEWRESGREVDSFKEGEPIPSDVLFVVPSKEDMEKALLERKKEEVLRKYIGPTAVGK